MSESTNISWADSTASPWFGCTEVSPGCANCYARELTLKYKWAGWGDKSPRVKAKSFWKDVPKWNAAQQKWKDQPCDPRFRPVVDQHPNPRIFPSLMDWLDPMVPIEWLADFLKLIHESPNLDWLLLTKRPELFASRIDAAFEYSHGEGWQSLWTQGDAPENVWIGTTVEDQKRADRRIPELLKIPAGVHWLSVEPLLEKVDLGLDADEEYVCSECRSKTIPTEIPTDDGLILKCSECGAEAPQEFYKTRPAIDWVVVGGESGGKRRDCGVEAIYDAAKQCVVAGVPVWVKQDSAHKPGQQGRIPDHIWNLKQLPTT